MAFVAAALAFVACKNIEDGGEIQPPAPEQGSGGNGGANQGGEHNLGQGENPGGGENDVPNLEYSCEITSVSMPNESISPKRVAEILDELFFDYTMTHLSTGAGYLQNYVPYENLPKEIKSEIHFKEIMETGDMERNREYEFPEDQKEIAFKIWHGGKSQFEKTLKNGNYNRTAITKKITGLLKEIIGEAEYEAISAKVATGNLTLTAETIKALGDIFPALEKDAESGKEAKDLENAAAILQNKEAFVAQAQGEIEVVFKTIFPDLYLEYPWSFSEAEINAFEKKYVVTYKANVIFKDTFNLSEISLPKNNGKGDFSQATLTNNGESIVLDKINDIRGNTKPTLSFEKNDDNVRYYTPEYNVSEGSVYDLYKTYSDNLGKLKIKGDFKEYIIDGKKISGKDNYTLFEEDGNTVKKSDNNTIKSLTIDALIQMYKQFKINYFVNMIISGEPTDQTEVDWILTNMVFEGDMSNIKQTTSRSLTGIVYFKNKPYNNIDNSYQYVDGVLKLDDLTDVSRNTFRVVFEAYSAVLDVSGVDKNSINSYNSDGDYGIVTGTGDAHAIYFSSAFSEFKNNPEKIKELCYKFSKRQNLNAGFVNAYLGEDRVNGESYDERIMTSVIGAKKARDLKEFEDFGNYFENNYMYKFEKTAKETYIDDWENLSDFDKGNLESFLNTIAQNTKKCIKAKSFV